MDEFGCPNLAQIFRRGMLRSFIEGFFDREMLAQFARLQFSIGLSIRCLECPGFSSIYDLGYQE
jgi:hypothetical protein